MTIDYALYRAELTTPSTEEQRHNRPTSPLQCNGYWRINAAKTKTDWPVLIWTSPDAPDNGTAVRIGGMEFNAKADPERWQSFATGSWLHCTAVTRDEYSNAINTGFWADGRPARNMTQAEKLGIDTEVRGDGTNAPTKAEILAEQIASLTAKLKAAKEPTTQDEADALQTLLDKMGILLKEAEAERVAEKEPHLQAGREVDARWKAIAEPGAEARFAADNRKKSYLKKEMQRRQAEAEAKAKEEAERRAAEQEERNRELAAQAESMGMPVEDLADPVAPEPIAPAPVEMPKASSAVGRASGLKKVRRGKITDLQMLIDYFFPADGNPDPEALAYLQGRVDKATRAKITLPGVTVMEDFE